MKRLLIPIALLAFPNLYTMEGNSNLAVKLQEKTMDMIQMGSMRQFSLGLSSDNPIGCLAFNSLGDKIAAGTLMGEIIIINTKMELAVAPRKKQKEKSKGIFIQLS